MRRWRAPGLSTAEPGPPGRGPRRRVAAPATRAAGPRSRGSRSRGPRWRSRGRWSCPGPRAPAPRAWPGGPGDPRSVRRAPRGPPWRPRRTRATRTARRRRGRAGDPPAPPRPAPPPARPGGRARRGARQRRERAHRRSSSPRSNTAASSCAAAGAAGAAAADSSTSMKSPWISPPSAASSPSSNRGGVLLLVALAGQLDELELGRVLGSAGPSTSTEISSSSSARPGGGANGLLGLEGDVVGRRGLGGRRGAGTARSRLRAGAGASSSSAAASASAASASSPFSRRTWAMARRCLAAVSCSSRSLWRSDELAAGVEVVREAAEHGLELVAGLVDEPVLAEDAALGKVLVDELLVVLAQGPGEGDLPGRAAPPAAAAAARTLGAATRAAAGDRVGRGRDDSLLADPLELAPVLLVVGLELDEQLEDRGGLLHLLPGEVGLDHLRVGLDDHGLVAGLAVELHQLARGPGCREGRPG